jgi:lysylphosphatidylglycerol synthetase-like protein (DUF2156 family)
MTTRYSLPHDEQQADTARSARTLAAIALVATVIGLSLMAVILPAAETPIAGSTDGNAERAAPVVTGA